MMNNMYVYVLVIAGSILNDDEDDFVVVTETKNLAINIAVQKLGKSTFTRQYGKWCAKRAEEFPSLPPLSYFDWLESSIANDDIAGITITPKFFVTYDNVDKIDF